jgi:hypothetical protein
MNLKYFLAIIMVLSQIHSLLCKYSTVQYSGCAVFCINTTHFIVNVSAKFYVLVNVILETIYKYISTDRITIEMRQASFTMYSLISKGILL